MNNVTLIGRLASEPDQKQTQSGSAMTSFRLAVKRDFYKQEGQPEADFLRVVTYGKTAENVGKYCYKGQQVGVAGRIQTGQYQTKSGETRYTTDIIGEKVEFLGKRDGGQKAPEGFHEYDEDDDDIPF